MDTEQRTYLCAAMQHRRAVNSIMIPAPMPILTEPTSQMFDEPRIMTERKKEKWHEHYINKRDRREHGGNGFDHSCAI